MKKNEIITVTVGAVGINGEGVARAGEYVIFVPFTLIGEKVKVKILKVKQNIAFAKAAEVLTPADDRVRPKCGVFTKCGGCQLQHMKYSLQLKHKGKNVYDCLKRIGGLEVEVLPVIKSEDVYAYRNKLQMPIGECPNMGTVTGFYSEGSHRIVPTTDCPIHPGWAADALRIINGFIKDFNLRGYDHETGGGLLRHLVMREIGGKFIICVVINGDKLENSDYLISKLKEKFRDFSFYMNINKEDTNVVFGKEFVCLYGEKKFSGEEAGIRYFAGPETFVQVNPDVRRKLYDRVVKTAADENAVAVDAYNGNGLLTAMLARVCKKAYGIEVVQEAVDCANELAIDNGLADKMFNICGDVAEKLDDLADYLAGERLVLVLDPPRKGIEKQVAESILKLKPAKIIYVSCSPATLARDLGLITGSLKYEENRLAKNPDFNLSESPYAVEFVQPYDMFPQTKHVECVCLLTRTEG